LIAGPTGNGPAATGSGAQTGSTGATHATTPTIPTQPPAQSGSARTAQGKTEQYGYGQLAVKVTVSGNRITGLSVPVLQAAEPYSQSLAQQVIPMLRNEVLSTQSARINGISGATYTSEAYAYSLQAALDSLHFK
jgi:uncharacterized protein with FMN-binding domain